MTSGVVKTHILLKNAEKCHISLKAKTSRQTLTVCVGVYTVCFVVWAFGCVWGTERAHAVLYQIVFSSLNPI